MERSPSSQADSRSANQEIPRLLWNPKVHYHVHNSPPLVSILSQMIQSTPSHSISLRSILILPSHLLLGLTSGVFPSGYPTTFFMPSTSHSTLATCSAYIFFLNLIKLITLYEAYNFQH